jgi:cytoskeletal protein RodZ
MPTVAEQLHDAREARNLSVHQVAETTKIKTDHIRALEAGDYNVFSAPVYIRGFVRTYSSLLKLDVAQVMATLDQELALTEKFCEPPSLSVNAPGPFDFLTFQLSRIKWHLVLPVVGVMLLLLLGLWGYRTWKTYQSRDPLSGLGPGVYQPTASHQGETLPVPTNTVRR